MFMRSQWFGLVSLATVLMWQGLAHGQKKENTPTPMPAVAPLKTLHAMPGGSRYAELAIEPFRPFCNVTLRWDVCPPYLRSEVEQRLAIALEHATPTENPAAGWFLGFSGLVFGTITMLAGMFVVLVLWRR